MARGVEGRHLPACCWAGAPGPWPCAGLGPVARKRGRAGARPAVAHGGGRWTAGLVLMDLDHPLYLPSLVHGEPSAARAPSPSFPLFSLFSMSPRGTQRSDGAPAPAFLGPRPLLPTLRNARCALGRGEGARSGSGLSNGAQRPERRACQGCSCLWRLRP